MATSKLTPFDGKLDDEQPASALTPFTGQLDGEKPRTRGLFEAVNDNVIEFANAAAGGVSALANFVKPGNAVSGFIDENIIKAGEQKQSDVVQGAKRQLSEGLQSAQGIGDEVGAVGRYVLDNPLLAASQAAGSFALPGGAVKGAGSAAKALGAGAKGVETAGRVGGIAAGAAMAGGDAAGTAYDLASKAGATDEQATAAGRQASVIPALVGGVTGAFGAERLLAGAKGFGGNALSRGLKSGLSEAGQEAVEEGVTQFEGQRAAMPYDESIDPTKGVAGAAAMGGIMGFGPGAVLGAMGGGPELPSKQMGIDPNAGPLSRAAVSAVDSQPVPQPLGASITGTAPADLMVRATDPLAEQITTGRKQAEAGSVAQASPAAASEPVPLEQRSLDELRQAFRSAQDPAIRKTLAAEIRKRREAMPDPLSQPQQEISLEPQASQAVQSQPQEAQATEGVANAAQTETSPAVAQEAAASPAPESAVLGDAGDPAAGSTGTSATAGQPNKLKEARNARRAADELRGTTGASTVTGGDITPPSVESPVADVRSGGRNDDAGTAQPDANGVAGRAVGSSAESPAALKKADVPETRFGNIESAKAALREALAEVDRVNDVWRQLYRDGVAYILGDGPSRKVAPNAPQDIKDRFEAFKKAKVAASRNYDAAAAAVNALSPKKERPVEPAKPEPMAQQEPTKKPRQLNGSDTQKAKALFTRPAGSTPRPDNWRGNAIKAGKVARSLGLDPNGKRLKEIVAEIDAVDAGSNVQNTQSSTTGTEAQAAPVEARAPEGGNAASDTGVPAAGGNAGVRADGVKVKKQAGPESVRLVVRRDIVGDKFELQGKSGNGEWEKQTTFDTDADARSALKSMGYDADSVQMLVSDWNAKAKRFNPPKPAAPGAGDVQADGVKEAKKEAAPAAQTERYEAGKALTKEQRKTVLASLVDVYKQKGADREMKGTDRNGNERFGYVHSPDLFEKSDITGSMVRYYVTLPDGRKAHPTELFPDVSASDVELMALEQEEKSKKAEAYEKALKPFYEDYDDADLRAGKSQVVIEKDGRFAIIDDRWGSVGKARQNGWEIAKRPSTAAQAEKPSEQVNPEPSKAVQPKAEKPAEEATAPNKPYDAARAQELRNSIAEGELILSSGKSNGKRLTAQQLEAVRRSVDSSRAKLDSLGEDDAFMGVEDDAPIFYSALRKEIEGLNLKSAPFLGWHGQLQGLVRAGKVKADELEWTGISEWLKLQTGKVSKEDVLAFLDANGVQVTETVLGDEARETAAERWMQERARLEFAMPFGSLDEADQDYIRGKAEDANIAPDRLTKYSQYTLPGGENYREVLLTLPVRSGGRLSGAALEEERFVRALKAKYGADVLDNEEASSRMTDEEANKLFRLSQATHAEFEAGDGYLGSSEIQSYESSHWDQKNVLAHIRVNDRTDAQGRSVLFVEEIQSDWGQDGKKKGFVDPARPYQVFDKRTGQTVAQFAEELDASRDSIQRGEGEFDYRDASGKTIAAPFVDKTDKWLALSLKRIMKMAVDGGYDAVAFVNGEQSAERYDLSKQVNSISWTHAKDGTYNIEADTARGEPIVRKGLTASELENTVGKEVAQKIVDGVGAFENDRAPMKRGTLSGVDLKVGGEGMKAFYDKIVPAAVKDVLKKVGGGQLETFSIDGQGDAEVTTYLNRQGIDGKVSSPGKQLAFTITDSMREKVAGGLPLFAGTKDKAKRQGTPVDRAIMDMAGEGREANEILSFIAKSSKSPYRRQLAQKLLATGANPAVSLGGEMGGGAGFRFLAKYSRKNHEVTLSEAAADRAEQIFLHETTHAATLLALDKGGLIATQMNRLYESVKAQGGADGQYGLKNLGEFVAEAFTNPDFQKALKGMKADNGSLWDRLVNIVRRILGMEPRQQDALSKALELGAGVMRENMPLRSARSFRAEDGPAFAGSMNGMPENQAPGPQGDAQQGADTGKRVAEVKERTAIRDEAGKPLRLYHGSERSFAEFDIEEDQRGVGGIWFTDSKNYAYDMSRGGWDSRKRGAGGQIVHAYLDVRNPFEFDVLAEGIKLADDVGVDRPTDSLQAQELLSGGSGWDSFVGDLVADAKRAGHDALVIKNFNDARMVDSTAVVVFDQKSIAIDRIETNDQSAPDTDGAYFGIADAVEQIKAFDVKSAPKNTWAHYRGMALQALGRRQLVDLYGDEFGTHLHEYDTLVQQMDAEKNETGAEADDIAQRWGKLKDEKALAELMHDATLAKMDPDKPMPAGYSKSEYDKLKTRFNTLSPEAKTLYREARDMYVAHYKAVQQAIKDRIERSEMSPSEKKRMMAQLDDKLFKELQGVYFPLARFGQYVIVVKDANGEVKNVTRAETVKEAEQARKELQKAFPAHMGNTVGKVLKQAEFNAGRDAVGKGFMADLMNALDEKGVDDELRDTVAQLYLSSLPDLSWAKHGIHRKGTPGFSQDARRAFAQNAFHGARYLAKLRYSDRLQDELTGMQEYVKAFEGVEEYDSIQGQQVVDEMVKRHEILMNPKSSPVSTALTSFGFLFHMGLSPASAMVNLTQTALVAFPQMGAKWGFTKAGAALTKASEEVVRAKNDLSKSLKGDELSAFERAVKDGTIDVTMAHDLAGIAQGEDQGVMWKVRPVMRWASFMFHHAEKFNRQATFLAAYRLSKETNQGRSEDWHYEEAKKATYDGHFDYSAANRARIMQGNWQRVILLFKQYGQSMIYTLARNAYQSVKAIDPKERTQARKTLGGILAAHAAAAGVLGLPIVGPLLTVASWIGGDDDEPWDAEVAMQNAMAEMIGPKAAEVVARGFSRLTPFDLSGRVALNKLILPDVQEGLEGKEWAESAMAAALGPVAGIGVNMARGAQKITEGDYLRGLEDMMPTALRGPLKAMRYANEGAVDKTGVVITDEVSAAGVLGQASGFSPSQVRRDTERRSAIYAYDRALLERRSVLMRMMAEARIQGDTETQAEVQKDIQRFNEKNPTRRITPMNIAQSVRNRRKRIDEAEQGVYLPSKRRDALDAVSF